MVVWYPWRYDFAQHLTRFIFERATSAYTRSREFIGELQVDFSTSTQKKKKKKKANAIKSRTTVFIFQWDVTRQQNTTSWCQTFHGKGAVVTFTSHPRYTQPRSVRRSIASIISIFWPFGQSAPGQKSLGSAGRHNGNPETRSEKLVRLYRTRPITAVCLVLKATAVTFSPSLPPR